MTSARVQNVQSARRFLQRMAVALRQGNNAADGRFGRALQGFQAFALAMLPGFGCQVLQDSQSSCNLTPCQRKCLKARRYLHLLRGSQEPRMILSPTRFVNEKSAVPSLILCATGRLRGNPPAQYPAASGKHVFHQSGHSFSPVWPQLVPLPGGLFHRHPDPPHRYP